MPPASMGSDERSTLSLDLLSDPGNARELRRRLEEFLGRAGLDGSAVERFVLAVNEAFANIVEHSYEGRHDGEIRVEVVDQGDRVEARLRDYGRKPREEELRPRALADVRPGGLGLHFIQAGTDEVTYDTSPPRGTLLRLMKRKDPEAR